MSETNLFSINPLQVERCLEEAGFNYPRFRDANFYKGWSKYLVIPGLYKLSIELNRCPTPKEGLDHLMDNCDDPKYKDVPSIVARGQKLYMDFCRDFHTFGLLQRNPEIASVQYRKALDIKNIDFRITLLATNKSIDVQCAMRLRWDCDPDPYEVLKQRRRQRRGDDPQQENIFWLTNRNRRISKQIRGCWLFGPSHIFDLVGEIKGNSLKVEQLALQELTP